MSTPFFYTRADMLLYPPFPRNLQVLQSSADDFNQVQSCSLNVYYIPRLGETLRGILNILNQPASEYDDSGFGVSMYSRLDICSARYIVLGGPFYFMLDLKLAGCHIEIVR